MAPMQLRPSLPPPAARNVESPLSSTCEPGSWGGGGSVERKEKASFAPSTPRLHSWQSVSVTFRPGRPERAKGGSFFTFQVSARGVCPTSKREKKEG